MDSFTTGTSDEWRLEAWFKVALALPRKGIPFRARHAPLTFLPLIYISLDLPAHLAPVKVRGQPTPSQIGR